MHPHIRRFIFEAVYDERLLAYAGAERQKVLCRANASGNLTRSCGIALVQVEHQFNAQASDEEVDAIASIVEDLVGGCVVDRDGNRRELVLEDVLIVAPYNMQVRRLRKRLRPARSRGSSGRRSFPRTSRT